MIGATEHQEQCLLFQWAEQNKTRLPELALLHAIPNAGGYSGGYKSNARRVERMKAEGVKPGVPDTHLPVARGGWLSLYIEMKRTEYRPTKTKGMRPRRTKPTPEQEQWMEALTAAGNLCVVCWSAEQAEAVLEDYLAGRLQRDRAA